CPLGIPDVPELGGEHDPVTIRRHGPPHQLLIPAEPVHVSRVEESHPQVDRTPNGPGGLRPIAPPVELGHPHAAESDSGDLEALAAQRPGVLDLGDGHRLPARELSSAPRLSVPKWTTSRPTVSSWKLFFSSD